MFQIGPAKRKIIGGALLCFPAFAHANWFTDGLSNFGTWVVLELANLFVMLAMMVLAAMMISIPIVADFALVIAAMLLPFCIAAWPITKTWATNAFSTVVSAALTSVAAAFFLSIILKAGGALETATTRAVQQITGAQGADKFGIALGASLGMIAFCVICLVVAMSIAGVVGRVFGGASIDGARIVATGTLAGVALAKGGAKMGANAAEGGARGAAAAASAGEGKWGVMKGAAAGAAAATRSQQRNAMLNRVKDSQK